MLSVAYWNRLAAEHQRQVRSAVIGALAYPVAVAIFATTGASILAAGEPSARLLVAASTTGWFSLTVFVTLIVCRTGTRRGSDRWFNWAAGTVERLRGTRNLYRALTANAIPSASTGAVALGLAGSRRPDSVVRSLGCPESIAAAIETASGTRQAARALDRACRDELDRRQRRRRRLRSVLAPALIAVAGLHVLALASLVYLPLITSAISTPAVP